MEINLESKFCYFFDLLVPLLIATCFQENKWQAQEETIKLNHVMNMSRKSLKILKETKGSWQLITSLQLSRVWSTKVW
jgi:hypothetical protein